ncbi:hypothetical protein BD309DRAFT_539330 [Dichomitus squalens]|nr:hypothetical protein BD309DRAFT_539330 [Dichomitus squalens]
MLDVVQWQAQAPGHRVKLIRCTPPGVSVIASTFIRLTRVILFTHECCCGDLTQISPGLAMKLLGSGDRSRLLGVHPGPAVSFVVICRIVPPAVVPLAVAWMYLVLT